MENNVTIETFLDRIFKMKDVTLNGVKVDISKYVEESEITASLVLPDSIPAYSYEDIIKDIELELEDVDFENIEDDENGEETGLYQEVDSLDDNITAQGLADLIFQKVNS